MQCPFSSYCKKVDNMLISCIPIIPKTTVSVPSTTTFLPTLTSDSSLATTSLAAETGSGQEPTQIDVNATSTGALSTDSDVTIIVTEPPPTITETDQSVVTLFT
ncbi:hypothetical protein BB559_000278 [Furculomyces boomerangus]|uniref:Uncharacterized protein n=1 Tax=Furculomyces boomerangus TaxID=61424 RepID=A0A2T9Z5P5_9FUNG|nr:hypothetical protein BB559_000278 [Furculomyces boomerangus]